MAMISDEFYIATALATLAGASIPIGAALSTYDRFLPGWLQEEFRHSVVAFGGGALMSAVALVLVPEGAARLAIAPTLVWFALGGLAFFLIDRTLAARGGHAAQFLAMMLDYVPEAMALGALLADNLELAILMAVLIALQNLPEGFNAFREMAQDGGASRMRLLVLFVFMVPIGPLAAHLGRTYLADHPAHLGAVMMFASGGILYLLFEDVAPQVPLERHWAPPLGAVAGFGLGLAGHMMVV
ncbi:zinc transporter, ZIP family [Sedimentitalea nanhaiensis]|uniref:Zinc transporter, ZIP family n=2 Tax=Sedimentitalea nanhaiensis TaxID=999627 RepID=A0A1I7CP86_9RHOB|nr:zinc transporter, ZIP family [Sedimentitalea nanhaiensis]